jgi:hypothetical protein
MRAAREGGYHPPFPGLVDHERSRSPMTGEQDSRAALAATYREDSAKLYAAGEPALGEWYSRIADGVEHGITCRHCGEKANTIKTLDYLARCVRCLLTTKIELHEASQAGGDR